MVSQACYSTGEGRRYSARACAPYMSFPERRYHFSPHDGRTLGMPDSHLDRGEAQPQRKRISVAVSLRLLSTTFSAGHVLERARSHPQSVPRCFPLVAIAGPASSGTPLSTCSWLSWTFGGKHNMFKTYPWLRNKDQTQVDRSPRARSTNFDP
ncbi:hypothetical protein VTK73DRAFT_7901 [Phialemonium thermophilum]|uniref:Uncharacterized protein n=1 Tax=Phialemonium thermophilum TaxID=223376 RepID=A0ABR3WC23_9PEZI